MCTPLVITLNTVHMERTCIAYSNIACVSPQSVDTPRTLNQHLTSKNFAQGRWSVLRLFFFFISSFCLFVWSETWHLSKRRRLPKITRKFNLQHVHGCFTCWAICFKSNYGGPFQTDVVLVTPETNRPNSGHDAIAVVVYTSELLRQEIALWIFNYTLQKLTDRSTGWLIAIVLELSLYTTKRNDLRPGWNFKLSISSQNKFQSSALESESIVSLDTHIGPFFDTDYRRCIYE